MKLEQRVRKLEERRRSHTPTTVRMIFTNGETYSFDGMTMNRKELEQWRADHPEVELHTIQFVKPKELLADADSRSCEKPESPSAD
jgi:hypothetical protein